jgi:hypothetical protein
MKKIINITAAIALVLTVFSACKPDESPYQDNSAKPKVTFIVSTANTNVIEGDQVYTITANMEYALNEDVSIYMFRTAGTASNADYKASVIKIQRGNTSATGTIKILQDDIAEGQETLTITIGDNRTWQANVIPSQMSFVIDNYVSDDLNITLDWSGDLALSTGTMDSCDIDLDLYIYDSGFNDVGHSWNDCPEAVTIAGSFPDGTYYIVSDLWNSPVVPVAADAAFDLPISVSYSKLGVFLDQSRALDPYSILINNISNYGGNGQRLLGTVVKVGTVYTVTDPSGATVASGRQANILENIRNNRNNIFR